MEYIRNHFLSSNSYNDLELRDLESGERSGKNNIYPSLPPGSLNSQMGAGGRPANISSYLIPLESVDASMQIETGQSIQTSPAEVEMQSEKRSENWEEANSNKVRIVPQTSKIPTLVSACNHNMK
jgi:hypothetical protein